MSNEYRVEVDGDACSSCRQGQTFGIVIPGQPETYLGHSFGERADAEEWCDSLNDALRFGRARLALIRGVYEQYKHLDLLLSDKDWLFGGKDDKDRETFGRGGFATTLAFDMWKAIRGAMEEQI